ncbi:hypothetical protein GCM10010222_11750 [Streptomyces tanashiensis]|nr:hypothetical protein GCM10010222_11750 [Streptomyces tanashiensis]
MSWGVATRGYEAVRVYGNEVRRLRKYRSGYLHGLFSGGGTHPQGRMPAAVSDVAQHFSCRPLQPMAQVVYIRVTPVGPGLLPRRTFLGR